MKTKTFKPLLAPNDEVDLDTLTYPLLCSYKMDGIRGEFHEAKILSRSLKPIQNKQLREKFEPVRKYSEHMSVTFDGEFYSPNLTFQEITSRVMTHDFEDPKSVKKHGCVIDIPDHFKYYCFDCIDDGLLLSDCYFSARLTVTERLQKQFPELVMSVPHKLCANRKEVEEYFLKALEDGYEGLILRNPKGRYKYGRGTIKEGIIYKLKPWVTFDAKIIDVEQSTVVDPNAEKTTNELNRSVTSKKQSDRILIEKASGYFVEYEGKTLTIPLGQHTDKQKEEVWANRETYIGRTIEYKAMEIGMKDVPRIPRFVRYREDKDE